MRNKTNGLNDANINQINQAHICTIYAQQFNKNLQQQQKFVLKGTNFNDVTFI